MNQEQIRQLKRVNAAALKNCPSDGISVRALGIILTAGMTLVGLVTIVVACMP